MTNIHSCAVGVRQGIRVDVDACLSLRPASIECGTCVEVCPADAIRWSDGGVVIESRCVDCGRCAAACPTGAITTDGYGALVIEATTAPGDLWIECSRVPARLRRPGAITVPCLGGVTPQHMLDRAAKGHSTVLLEHGWCANCPAGGEQSGSTHEAVAEAVCDLHALGAVHPDRPLPQPRIEPLPLPAALAGPAPTRAPGAGVFIGRRGFFSALRAGAGSIAAVAVRPRHTRSRAACRPSDTLRQRRRDRAEALAAVARRVGSPLSAAAFPVVAAHEGCCHEGVCVAGCPSGALRIAEDESEHAVGLDFDASLCLGCGLCAQLCPHHALSVASAGVTGEGARIGPVALVRHELRTCSACADAFVARHETFICARCAMARDQARNLFGARPSGPSPLTPVSSDNRRR